MYLAHRHGEEPGARIQPLILGTASLVGVAPLLAARVPWGAALTAFVFWVGPLYLQTCFAHIEAMEKLRTESAKKEPE